MLLLLVGGVAVVSGLVVDSGCCCEWVVLLL